MDKNCIYCGAGFTSKRRNRKYCSDNCKQMAYFKRNGLILSGHSQLLNVTYGSGSKTKNVKYVKYEGAKTHFTKEKTQGSEEQNYHKTAFIKPSEQQTDEQKAESENNDLLSLEEPEYKWVESSFIKSIEKSPYRNNAHLFKSPLAHWHIDKVLKVNWISIRLRCLIESMIRISQSSKIDSNTLLNITDAFNRLTRSNAFNNLPDNYPYTGLIKELCAKLNGLAQNEMYAGELKFTLSVQLKSRLISIRLEMMLYFPVMKFSELDFSEKNNLFEKNE